MARATYTVEMTRMEKREMDRHTAYVSVPDGQKIGMVELLVDVTGLLDDLGPRAVRNRSKRATAVRGRVVARVIGDVERIRP